MDKESAVKKVEELITDREFSLESISIVDKEPVETEKFWIFKNLCEPREALRENSLNIITDKPRVIINKASGNIRELTSHEFEVFLGCQ